MTKIGIYIDVSDFYYRVRRKFDGAKLNYQAYKTAVHTWGDVVEATAYCMQQSGEAAGFIAYLRSHGFKVRHKRPKIIKINDRTIKQCDWGVGMTIDVVSAHSTQDHIVLGVSNPDYIPLIKALKERGTKVTIFASCVPASIRDIADEVVEIDESHLQE